VCGIAGFTHARRADGLIEKVTASLAHRGPDQRGAWESPEISLGAVRLKIIDLAGGDQPFVSEDGATALAFNGEIYNHRELRGELEARGHRFRTQCDTEVVLRAFLEWDTGCFGRLRGMFAAALWSQPARRLVLARDRLGIKPLYFCRQAGRIHFGSELKAILAHPAISRQLNREALSSFLAWNYIPGPATLVEGIEKLPPGHLLEWQGGETRLSAWWRLELRPRPRRLEEATEELDGLLRSAVREHLVADVPAGIWASGGVDSSTILHYAAENCGRRLKTFSVSFRGRSFDESPYFREIARIYGTDHTEFDLNPEAGLLDVIEEMAYHSDEPGADAGALPVWYLARLSRREVTVALSGEGADELFGGYLTYAADRLARLARPIPARLRQAALRAAARLPVSDEKISFEYKLKRWLAGSLLPADEAHFFWNGACSPDELRALTGRPASLPELRDAGGGWLNRYLLADQQYYLPDNILYKVDRMSMAHSLEVRPPFLDHRIVEWAASLPENLKIRGLSQKYILKQLMRRKLPRAVLRRQKTGFDIPAHDWLRGPLRGLLLETLAPAALKRARVADPAAVERLIQDHLEKRANNGYQLWGLMTLCLWIARWRIETRPAEQPGGVVAAVR